MRILPEFHPHQIPQGHQFHVLHQGWQENQIAHQGRKHGDHHHDAKNGRRSEAGKGEDGETHTNGQGGEDDGFSNMPDGIPERQLVVQVFLEFPVVAHKVMDCIVHCQADGNTGDEAGYHGELDAKPSHDTEIYNNWEHIRHDGDEPHLAR